MVLLARDLPNFARVPSFENAPRFARRRYKQNRCAMFDSKRLHETAKYNFKEGYKNRRINLTLLFGREGASNIELVNKVAAI